MEREVLGKASPLFGRRTAQLHLQPFGYLEAARFHPRWSPEDRAKAYFLVGGLPQYLLCLDDARSVARNVRGNLIDEVAPLFHEPEFLLREELREVAPYHAVLFAVASGHGAAPAVAAAAETALPRGAAVHLRGRGRRRRIRGRRVLEPPAPGRGPGRFARRTPGHREQPLSVTRPVPGRPAACPPGRRAGKWPTAAAASGRGL